MSVRIVFTARPWSEADGDPAHPSEILGVQVERELCAPARDAAWLSRARGVLAASRCGSGSVA
jgi:hypothetical protein